MASSNELSTYYDLDPSALPSDLDLPLVLVNHFALNEHAQYNDPTETALTGLEAMMRYAAVSSERLASVGGQFLVQSLAVKALWGSDEAWDLVVVATYPSGHALLNLLSDTQYQAAYVHRRAALRQQRVSICSSLL